MAVDLHRNRMAVMILDAAGNEVKRLRLPTTCEGEAQLRRLLKPQDRVVLEATTGAHRLANYLEQSGATVLIADPQQNRLLGMRGKKSDWYDCDALLSHMRSGELVLVWRPDAPTREMRQLTRERLAYNQNITRLKNRVQMLLWEEGFERPSHLWNPAGQAWLAEQPLRPAARRIVMRELAALAGEKASKTALEEEMAQRAIGSAEAQRLMQIVGVGPETAVMLLGEIGLASRFARAAQLVSYAGLNPRLDQSDGPARQGLSITKAGRRPLRWLMVEAAWNHVRSGGPEAEHYHRLVERGKPKGVAIVALARRLLVLAWILLVRRATEQHLDAGRYQEKLADLAAQRPIGDERQLRNIYWAAQQVEDLLGVETPQRQRMKERPSSLYRKPPPQRRSRTRTAVSVSPARGERSEFPAQEESDPSERSPLAASCG